MLGSQYPFFKLTLDEKFPRLLVTRRPDLKTGGQTIYGAFLPTGMTRRMLDLLQRIFRLRPCELDIRGDFDAPCPEYFLHRCLAPCVATICDRETYLETVEIVHLILSNQAAIALKKIDRKIENLAEDLQFELAAEWRDKRLIIEEIARNAKWQINVSTMNDVIVLSRENNQTQIHLTTLRRGKAVGRLNFTVENSKETDAEIVARFVREFYQYYAPKQIFVPFDFPERKQLENDLSRNLVGKIKIVAKLPEKLPVSIVKTQTLAAQTFHYRKGQSNPTKSKLLDEIIGLFKLPKQPRRIECFDVAHLAGQSIVAARVVAVDGALNRDEGLVWEFENLSETHALAAAVYERLRLLHEEKDRLDLLIIDGSKAQINAVVKILKEFDFENLSVVGAVKPPQQHNQISHFLNVKDERVEFVKNSAAMNFLQTLRDAAHTLANETHRELHSLVQIFANNETAPQIKYLLVPTGYAEPNGNAGDLSPIRSMTQAGELMLKTKSKRPNNE